MKKIYIVLVCIFLTQNLYARELINANFNNLTLENLIKITSKIIGKNILISTKLSGKVNFIYNKPIYKDEVLDILKTILASKGFQIIENNNVLNVIAIANQDEVKVIYLKNTKAIDILQILNDLEKTSKKEKSNTISISLFEDTNAIILKGTASKVFSFSQLIEQLDIEKQQVYVQARIIEVSERKTQNIGIQYGLNGFNASSSGLMTFASSLNSAAGNPSLSLTELSGYGYSPNNLRNGLSLGATINLLKQNNALDIISEPSILCINNKESSIYVGETRSIPTGTTVGTTTTTNFKREDIGLKLIVKPRISNKNKVTLELRAVLEDIKETDVITGNPNTNKKEVVTTVMVNNGESVILGGLIKNKLEKVESKVPLLGDIPYFGSLFRNNYDINDKINLIVIVTPYIIPKSKDLTFVINQLTNLKIIEQKYTNKLLKDLEKKKHDTNKKENVSNSQTKNQKKHKQRLKDIFDL
jgi:general secretion pathway protein D